MFEGSSFWSNIGTGAIIAIVIACTLLPVWPQFAKVALWYLAVTFLLLMIGFVIIRTTLFVICWIVGYDFWILPRIFDDSLMFLDTFKPIYSFEKVSPGQGYYRIALTVMLAGIVAWVASQPSEFDGFLAAQKTFVDDLYSGNLLADVPHFQKKGDYIDKLKSRMVNLDDLISQIEADEALSEVVPPADAEEQDTPVSDHDAVMEELLAEADEE